MVGLTEAGGPTEAGGVTARRWSVVAALVAVAACALALRSIELPWVLSSDGSVVLTSPDAYYHARLAFYAFVNFPDFLRFDPYLAYPTGAEVPLPPLFDWGLAGLARVFGDDQATFERVAIWISPVLGVLATLCVFAAGRRLRGAACGLVAAGTYAVLPLPTYFARVGNPDHHAAVALIGALWLWVWLESVLSVPDEGRGWVRSLLHGLATAAMLLTWSGSLVFVGIAEAAGLLAVGIVGARLDLVRNQGLGAALAALLVVPFCLAGGEFGGGFTSTTLSWLHPLVLACLALLCAGLCVDGYWRPSRGVSHRALRAGGLAILIALLAFSLFPLASGIASGVEFVTGEDTWAFRNPEQQPLYRFLVGERPGTPRPPFYYYGVVTYLLPLVPLLLLWLLREPRRRLAAVVLVVWTSAFGLLAISQLRFGNELGAPLCVALAWVTLAACDRFVRRLPATARALISAGVIAALIGPGALAYHQVRVDKGQGRSTAWRNFSRFFEEVRRVTPETRGFLEKGEPEYGLLVAANIGHLAVYRARRPTPAGNLGPNLDPEKFELVSQFYSASRESEAVEIADRLGTRFVVASGKNRIDSVGGDLDRRGTAHGNRAHLGRFRLLTERGVLNLFEIVPGAVLEAQAEPGEQLVAQLGVVLPEGAFRFEARGIAGPDGWIRVRVPYATGDAPPNETIGPYRVTLAGHRVQVEVGTEDVTLGRSVRVVLSASEAAH